MGDIFRYHVQKYDPPNCMFLTDYHWSHLDPLVWKVQGVTLYQKQYRELVLGSAAVCCNKLYGLECDCDVIFHLGRFKKKLSMFVTLETLCTNTENGN
jgi:hypothetical protein